MSDTPNGITVTLKAGPGFESPWIVVHAADAADALAQINTGEFATLAERTVSAAEFFRAAHNVKSGLAASEPQQQQQAAPQQQQSWSQQGSGQTQAPAAPAPGGDHRCVHGPREYKDFTSKAGKHVKMWACTAKHLPREQQCEPEWVR